MEAALYSLDPTQEDTMKILYFNDYRLGILNGQNVVDVMDVVRDIPHTGPHNLP